MIILHYIPKLTKNMGRAAEFVQQLQAGACKGVETHFLTGTLSQSAFLRRLATVHPDVVHLHGCWDYQLARAEQWTLSHGYPVVLSLHGGLMSQQLQDKFWKQRLPRIIAYQFRVVRNASVIHVASADELKEMKELGWKKRIALIPYPANDEQMAIVSEQLHDLYQKLVDTHRRNRLSIREQECLWTLLYASVAIRHRMPEIADDVRRHITDLPAMSWKTIQVYAIDHSLHDSLLAGAKVLGINIPEVITTLPSRYSVKSTLHDAGRSSREEKIAALYARNNTELSIGLNLYHLHRTINNGERSTGWKAPLPLLLDLYAQLRWDEYDEDIINEIIKYLDIRSFSARVMQILSETLPLSIGFMPLDPIDDLTTDKIRKRLNTISNYDKPRN